MTRPKAWFAFYPADFEADTADLNLEEIGAYIRLLDFHFLNDSIPTDIKRTASILRVSPQKTRKLLHVLMRFFYEKDGRLFQKRMVQIIEQGIEISEKRAQAGKKGGEANATLYLLCRF